MQKKGSTSGPPAEPLNEQTPAEGSPPPLGQQEGNILFLMFSCEQDALQKFSARTPNWQQWVFLVSPGVHSILTMFVQTKWDRPTL